MPVALKTVAASGAAAAFRILLMPVDATKTIMQAGKGCGCMVWACWERAGMGRCAVLFSAPLQGATLRMPCRGRPSTAGQQAPTRSRARCRCRRLPLTPAGGG